MISKILNAPDEHTHTHKHTTRCAYFARSPSWLFIALLCLSLFCVAIRSALLSLGLLCSTFLLRSALLCFAPLRSLLLSFVFSCSPSICSCSASLSFALLCSPVPFWALPFLLCSLFFFGLLPCPLLSFALLCSSSLSFALRLSSLLSFAPLCSSFLSFARLCSPLQIFALLCFPLSCPCSASLSFALLCSPVPFLALFFLLCSLCSPLVSFSVLYSLLFCFALSCFPSLLLALLSLLRSTLLASVLLC